MKKFFMQYGFNKHWLSGIALAAMLAFSLVSCGDGAGGGDNNQTPVAGDYTAENMTQYAGFVTDVSITANAGKSPGAISNIRYAGNTSVPQAVGNYAVTFDVAAATGWEAATELSVGNLEVEARPDYGIVLDPAGSRNFGSVEAGYSAQTAHSVKVKNVGINDTGELTIALSGTDAASFTLSKTSISDIAAGESDNFTVVPNTGLPAANYSATVTVSGGSGDDVFSANFMVSFTVTATYTISATVLTSFGSPRIPYTQPAAQTVTISNTGTGNITLTQPSAVNYDIGTLSQISLNAGQIATFTVRPKSGLPAGNRDETININGTNGAHATVNVDFTVRPTGTLSVFTQSGSMTAGVAGNVSYLITATGIDVGLYIAAVANLPQGVSVNYNVNFDFSGPNLVGTLVLSGDTTTIAGETKTLTLTIDGVTSSVFTLIIIAGGETFEINPTDLIGTWKVDGGTTNIIFTSDSFTSYSSDLEYFTIEDFILLNIENDNPATKDEYPKGYGLLEGTMTAAVGTCVGFIGEKWDDGPFFFNVAKNKILYNGFYHTKQ